MNKKTLLLIGVIIIYLSVLSILVNVGVIDVNIPNYDPSGKSIVPNIHERTDDSYFEMRKNISQEWNGFFVRTNSLGLRDNEYWLQKGNSTYRIIVLGDSITFGFGAGQNDTYPKLLEEKLKKNNPDVEVWNAGIAAYNAYQENILLKKLINYEPDMIVIGFFQNDVSYPVSFMFGQEIFWKKHRVIAKLDKTAVSKLGFYRLIRKKMYDAEERKEISLYNEKYDVNRSVNEKAFTDMIKLCDDRNIPVIMLNIPYLLKTGTLSPPEQEFISKFRENYTVIDILPEYKKAGDEWYKTLTLQKDDDKHPNREGHELIAERLYKEIITGRYLA